MRSQIPSAPHHVDPLSATDVEGGTPGLRMCGSLTPANAEQHRKREALSVVGRTPEGLTKAMSHDTSTPSVNGQTLEGVTSEANLSSMEQAREHHSTLSHCHLIIFYQRSHSRSASHLSS